MLHYTHYFQSLHHLSHGGWPGVAIRKNRGAKLTQITTDGRCQQCNEEFMLIISIFHPKLTSDRTCLVFVIACVSRARRECNSRKELRLCKVCFLHVFIWNLFSFPIPLCIVCSTSLAELCSRDFAVFAC